MSSASDNWINWSANSCRVQAPPASPSRICRSNYVIVKSILRKLGDDAMKPDQLQLRFSSIGITLFVVSFTAGAIVSTVWNNPGGAIAGGLLGLYLLYAIRVADQWEKVAVLRM